METTHYNAYCESMKGSMPQKLFFLAHLPKLDSLLDFGCADGSLLLEVMKLWPKCCLAGYDRDPAMIAKCDEHFPDLIAYDKYVDAMAVAEFASQTFGAGGLIHPSSEYTCKGTGILFSSILHEMYSEYTAEEMKNFWMEVAVTGTDYIIIRDMFTTLTTEPNLTDAVTMECLVSEYPGALLSYEAYDGDLTTAKGLLEFQLKLPYLTNWEHEVAEKYLSVPDLRPQLAELGYECILWDHHQVPFVQERIKADTGIDNPFNTHLKAIFKRKQHGR